MTERTCIDCRYWSGACRLRKKGKLACSPSCDKFKEKTEHEVAAY